MTQTPQDIARACMQAAYDATRSFPDIVATLMDNGFESYRIDYMRHTATYFLSDGSSFELPLPRQDAPVARVFDAAAVQAAVKEAQTQAEGYTYKGFCDKVAQAGCAGYIVSFPGRRVLYFGRTAETHVEHFPQ